MYIFRLIIGPVIIRGKCGMADLWVEGDSLGMMNYDDNKHASHETGNVIRIYFISSSQYTLFAHPSAQHDDNNSVDFCRYHVAFVNSVVLVKLANRCVYAPTVGLLNERESAQFSSCSISIRII